MTASDHHRQGAKDAKNDRDSCRWLSWRSWRLGGDGGFVSCVIRNPRLAAGLGVMLAILLFCILGRLLVQPEDARPLSSPPERPPSWEYPLGTDDQGRDLFAVMVVGVPLTLRIGLLAGAVGLGVGTVLGFLAGYLGGKVDAVIRSSADTLLTLPGLVVLVTIASSIEEGVSVNAMALVVASLSWMHPTRTIRSQVLSMRERAYVQMAKLNGMGGPEIIWRELLPCLYPYLAACFVVAVSSGVLASIGLEALGLGPQNEPTVGMTIHWAIAFNSIIRGMWWWWGAPIVFLVALFAGLFLIAAGLLESREGGAAPPHPPDTTADLICSHPPRGIIDEDLLLVRDLRVHYETPAGPVRAVDGVSLSLRAGERFGLVGESGSGKSTLVHALLRIIKPPGRILGGEVILEGTDLMKLSEEEMRRTRLARIALVPQGAMNSLNPVMRVKDQMILAMKAHAETGSPVAIKSRATKSTIKSRVAELLESVMLEERVGQAFPHELSGGMKQRVCIAMAISLGPEILVADEPTTALDVIVQRSIMQMLLRLRNFRGLHDLTTLLVSHDMGLMAQFVDRVGVMYGGRLVEVGEVGDIFGRPMHPYARLLIASVPTLERRGVLRGIPGMPVSVLNPPEGCLFHPRCPDATDRCRSEVPILAEVRPGRHVACLVAQESAQ